MQQESGYCTICGVGEAYDLELCVLLQKSCKPWPWSNLVSFFPWRVFTLGREKLVEGSAWLAGLVPFRLHIGARIASAADAAVAAEAG